MIDSLSIAVYAFVSGVSMSFSVDETLLPKEVNFSTRFRELPPSVEMSLRRQWQVPYTYYTYIIVG